MEAKPQQPQDDENHEECPEHLFFLANGRHGVRSSPQGAHEHFD
jgi:hypothetical protein